MQHNKEKLGDVDKIRNGNSILIEWEVSSVEFSALHILLQLQLGLSLHH